MYVWMRRHWKILVFSLVLVCSIVFWLPAAYFYTLIVGSDVVETTPVGIVFGAGLKSDGTPSDVLKDRLDVAADLYDSEKIERILVSGDNSTTDYDEPSNMMRYLVNERNIPEESVFRDFAGRRTFDTCIRAKEVWGIERAILISQGYHLPRALMTCSAQGIEVQGVSASRQVYQYRTKYRIRELFAYAQALVDVYIWTPSYIGGKLETDLDQ